MNKPPEISNVFYTTDEKYARQRMTSSEWKQHLLLENDRIVVRGRCRQLKAKSLGCGVVEIRLIPLKGEAK